MGIITPIHKRGSKGLPKQYRPVVLTFHLIKIFERILHARITQHLQDITVFNEGQHGFRRGRSCLSQLLLHYESILENIQDGNNADVIYLDFAKAFDKADHRILLHKLKANGVSGKVGHMIYNFLKYRTQRVTVQGVL